MALTETYQPQQLYIERMGGVPTVTKPRGSGSSMFDGRALGGKSTGSHPGIVLLIKGVVTLEYMSTTDDEDDMLTRCGYLGW